MKIVIAKTIAGTFLIGKLIEKLNPHDETETQMLLSLEDVFSLVLYYETPNSDVLKTTIAPIMFPFTDQAIKEVSLNNLIGMIEAPDDIQQTYIKATTGIEIVTGDSKFTKQ